MSETAEHMLKCLILKHKQSETSLDADSAVTTKNKKSDKCSINPNSFDVTVSTALHGGGF